MSVALVIPCFNEIQRLPIEAFRDNLPNDLRVLFVDDGSSDWHLQIS